MAAPARRFESFSGPVSDSRRFKVRLDGEPVEGHGPYESEEALVEGLEAIHERLDLGHGRGTVHVYEDANTSLGVGQTYVGWVDAGSILMAGEVPENRIRGS